MTQFLKQNWFGIAVIIILLLVIFLYFFSKDAIRKSPDSNLNLQAQCSTQALKTLADFETGSSKDGFTDFSQENHYNQKLNKCFVLIDYRPVYSSSTNVENLVSNNESLFNAYENVDLADCAFFMNTPPYDDSNDTCNIGVNGATFQEYSDFVKERMELSR